MTDTYYKHEYDHYPYCGWGHIAGWCPVVCRGGEPSPWGEGDGQLRCMCGRWHHEFCPWHHPMWGPARCTDCSNPPTPPAEAQARNLPPSVDESRNVERMIPVYEAKMMHHYDTQWATYGGRPAIMAVADFDELGLS